MDNNILNLLSNLSSMYSNNSNNTSTTNYENTIPSEISKSYPYGDFPIRYTKSGQEYLRQKRESGYTIDTPSTHPSTPPPATDTPAPSATNINIQDLLPLLSTLNSSNGSSNPINILKTLAPILFKDNPNIVSMLDYIKPPKSHSNTTTNTLCIDKCNIDEYIPIT